MDLPEPFRRSSRKFARSLRRAMTRSETMLWWELRNHQIDGHAFRRQMPVGPFIADFACPEARLVVEIDGRTHAGRGEADAARDMWFRCEGWRVLRFDDDRVIGGLPLVVAAIRQALTTR